MRRVVADAGYWSTTNVNMPGVESSIAPGRHRNLSQIAESDRGRAAILDRVEAGEMDTAVAAEELGVTRACVNQRRRRRRAGDPDPLTTTMIAKLDTPKGHRTYSKRPRRSNPSSRRSSTTARSGACPGEAWLPSIANGS